MREPLTLETFRQAAKDSAEPLADRLVRQSFETEVRAGDGEEPLA
jgi:hypothetical protein